MPSEVSDNRELFLSQRKAFFVTSSTAYKPNLLIVTAVVN